MKNTAVVNGTDLRAPAFRPLVDGSSSFARALEAAGALPEVQGTVLFLSTAVEAREDYRAEMARGPLRELVAKGALRVVVRERWSVADLLDELGKAASDSDAAFYFFADCPFMDVEISRRMRANHTRYWADYSFADGYPYGLAPEIMSAQTVARLRALAGEGAGAPDRETLFTLVKKDINSFDIETEISPSDMRMLRVSLCADTERNFLLLRRVVQEGGRDASSVCAALQGTPLILRTLPAFFPVQIVERCPHACSYCPYPVFGGNVLEKSGLMPLESFTLLAKKIAAFCGDAVIDVSLWGEPSLHPRIFDFVAAVLQEPGLDLVIETSGVGWEPGIFSRIRSSFAKAPTWIVSLDASNEGTYQALRGSGFAEASRAAEELLRIFPAHAWVQAVRMKENEEDLEVFYKKWKALTENVIIQKYDSFGGMLPDRKVADLSPVKRFPCWHLKRDMAVLLDGTVPLCREDVRVQTPLGNALSEDLGTVWERAQKIYTAHVSGAYPGICAGCDEYYTYNY
jgi:spiro-SPASM protein